jgi:hypothetical protein
MIRAFREPPVRKLRLFRESRVTIALGFQCSDGIVLCADRQHTMDGGLKFEQQKILSAHVIINDVTMKAAFTYAHDPLIAKNLFEAVCKVLPGARLSLDLKNRIFLLDAIQASIEDVCRDRKYKNTESLIAVTFPPNASPLLIITRGPTVARGIRECIGIGRSPLIQYFSDLLSTEVLTTDEAKVAGMYLVLLANRYVDGCGGGPDVLILKKDGEFEQVTQTQVARYKSLLESSEAELKVTLVKAIKLIARETRDSD